MATVPSLPTIKVRADVWRVGTSRMKLNLKGCSRLSGHLSEYDRDLFGRLVPFLLPTTQLRSFAMIENDTTRLAWTTPVVIDADAGAGDICSTVAAGLTLDGGAGFIYSTS
ncbi:hypothetical protein GCM10011411_07800 [Aurantiacibacter arachoides]|nr:hypothetical protein GCM10011411_07800 [Aurantiacibacter arachoides]